MEGCDFIFFCVGNDDDLCFVIIGLDGVFYGMKVGVIFVDNIIVFVEVVCEFFVLVNEKGCGFIDVLVFGG